MTTMKKMMKTKKTTKTKMTTDAAISFKNPCVHTQGFLNDVKPELSAGCNRARCCRVKQEVCNGQNETVFPSINTRALDYRKKIYAN